MPSISLTKLSVPITFGALAFGHGVGLIKFNVPITFRPLSVFSANSTTRPLVFLVNGIDRTAYVSLVEDPCTITMGRAATPTCSYTVITDGTYRPDLDDDVVIILASTGERVFGGNIDWIEERNPTGTDTLKIKVRAQGYAAKLEKRIVAAWFEYPNNIIYSPQTMLIDILRVYIPEEGITMAGGGDGPIIDTEIIFQYVTAAQAARQLLQPNGLDFYIDEYKRFWIVDPVGGFRVAPFNVADGDGNVLADAITVRKERSGYANRVYLRSDLRQPGFWTDTLAGDQGIGAAISFYFTAHITNDEPVVFVNGVQKTVGIFGVAPPGSVDFTWVPGGQGVKGAASYTGSDIIEIIYPSPLQPVTVVEDPAEIAAHGIFEAIEDVKDVYDPDRWDEIAAGILARKLQQRPYYTVDYETNTPGLRPGMTQNINLTAPQVPNLDLVIDSINGTWTPHASGGFFRWRVTASSGPVQTNKSDFHTFVKIRDQLGQAQDRHRDKIVVELAMTEGVVGDPNPGLVTGVVPGRRTIDKPSFLKQVKLTFSRSGSQTDTAQIDVMVNGTTIWANTEYIEYAPTDTGTVVKYNFSAMPFRLDIGDEVTAEVVTADSSLYDGTMEIETQG